MSDIPTQEEAIRQLYLLFSKLKEEVDSQQVALARIQRPWYKEGATLIAVLAFLFSLSTTVFSYIQTKQQHIHDLRTEVRATLLQFSELGIETLKSQERYRNNPQLAGLLGDKAGGVLGLLAVRVSELAMEIPYYISVKEHLTIAQILFSADRPGLSKRHTVIALERSKIPRQRFEAMKLLAFYAQDSDDLSAMRSLYNKALGVAENMEPPHISHWKRFLLLKEWSKRELDLKQCDEFGRVIDIAGTEFMKLRLNLQKRVAKEFKEIRNINCIQ